MRLWLNPQKLLNFRLTPADVRQAVTAQNAQISAGQLGATPSVAGQQLNATVTAQSRLQRPEQFEEIVLRTEASGASSAARATTPSRATTASPPPASPFSSRPAPTRSRPPPPFAPRSTR
jgi:hypothetical protein